MEENEDYPVLLACLPLSSKFAHLKKIIITSGDFTVGRSLSNSVCIPFITISRKHCTFKKVGENDWYVEDHSTAGIKVNDEKLGQGHVKKLEHEDLITLEPSDEFSYKFTFPSLDVFETPRKRMKMSNTTADSTIINDVKLKFEESQKCEIQHIEDKIQNAKQMQTTSMILKKQLQEDMNRKIQQLENEFSVQIENLKGEKNEVEKQKATLIEERDMQLTSVKNEMKGKITELMEQIAKHNETETELLQENSLLKEKLMKEREDFLSELNRESSSKQDMLNKLEAKIREQEEVRLTERKELEDTLRRETEQLRLAKEKELKEMAEQKHLREEELEQELNNIRKNFAEQVEQTEQQRIKAEQELKLQMEQMNKLQAEEKAKMDQFLKEKEEIQNKLTEAQIDAAKSQVEVQARVTQRETELAALAAERIQKQVDQSSEVISTLQEQLEKVKSQLQTVETEKNTLLETICMDPPSEGTSKQDTLNEFSELMENELQCSICAELFVEPTTLYCSHTFCKYCITMWKKKKHDCPICRSPITSECKSLVLVSFIEKMVQNLTDEMKTKRQEMLKHRAAEVQSSSRPATTSNSRRRRRTTTRTTFTSTSRRRGSAPPTHPQIPTVDLTTPPMRPPLIPVHQVASLRIPYLPSRQIQTENLTMHQIPTDVTPASQMAIGRTDSHQISTVGGPRLPIILNTINTTPTMQIRSFQQGQTYLSREINQTPACDRQMTTDTRHITTDRIVSRQIQTENPATSLQHSLDQTRSPISQILIDLTQTGQPGGHPISTVGGPTMAIIMNQTERSPAVQLSPLRQVRQTERENLTTPLQVRTVDQRLISPICTQTGQISTETLQIITTNGAVMVPILTNPTDRTIRQQRPTVVTLEGGGVVTSQVLRTPTTAAMVAASHAVPAAIGPRAALSDNENQS